MMGGIQIIRKELIGKLTRERSIEIQQTITNRDSKVRMELGVQNNTTYYILMNALDSAKRLPQYKHKIKHAFGQVAKELNDYESKLMHGYTIQYFTPERLSKSNVFVDNITSEDLYEIWKASGGAGYMKIKEQTDVLLHKICLSLENHNVPNVKEISEIILGSIVLEACVHIYGIVTSSFCSDMYEVNPHLPYILYKDFSLESVCKKYKYATDLLSTDKCYKYVLDEFEERNMDFALQSFCDRFTSTKFVKESYAKAIKDYRELLRGNKEYKELLKTINEIDKI